MNILKDNLLEWIKGILIDGIMSNFSGLFDALNENVSTIAGYVGMTPQGWNADIFNMIKTLSETVLLPVAGLILAYIMCYELIHMIIDKNNLHDVDTWMFFKWIFKTFIAVLIITNTWNITMGIFDVSQSVVQSASGVIISETNVGGSSDETDMDVSPLMEEFEKNLEKKNVGELLGLWLQSFIVGLAMMVLAVIIFIVIIGRMMEIYLLTAMAPIPIATLPNREWGTMGQNYLKSLLALAFQAFLIMVCVAIYAILMKQIVLDEDVMKAVWVCLGYTALLCSMLFKTGSLAKSIFHAH